MRYSILKPVNLIEDMNRLQHYATKEWGNWLADFNWTYFGTLTTSYRLTPKSARRLAERFHQMANTLAPMRMFWIAESFDMKEGQHIHALIQIYGNIHKKTLRNIFQKACGKLRNNSWNRIDLKPYDRKRQGAQYVTKDLKYNSTDYDILEPSNNQLIITDNLF